MQRQTEIAAQQADIEQTRLRAELYDRRVTIYAGIDQYLAESSMTEGEVKNEVREGLFKSLAVARFILGEDVEKIAREIHSVSMQLRSVSRRIERLHDHQNAERSGLFDKQDTLNDKLEELQSRLRETKERYLRLSS